MTISIYIIYHNISRHNITPHKYITSHQYIIYITIYQYQDTILHITSDTDHSHKYIYTTSPQIPSNHKISHQIHHPNIFPNQNSPYPSTTLISFLRSLTAKEDLEILGPYSYDQERAERRRLHRQLLLLVV